MLGLFRSQKRTEPYDFAQIVGSCTEDGRRVGANWDNVNIADGNHEGAQRLARHFVNFHRGLIGKDYMAGQLEPSASLANFAALQQARERTGKNKVLCSNLSHISIARACQALGLDPVVVDAKPEQAYQVDGKDAEQAISEHGNDIAAVVSTFGTTQLGHIERLAELDVVKQLVEDGAWLHIDAAYGGYIGTLARDVKTSLPDADSITLDPYKFVGKPGVALLMIDEGKVSENGVEYYVQSPLTKHTTLSAGPVAAWGKTVDDIGGVYYLGDLANEMREITRRSIEELQSKYGVELLCQPELTIIPVALDSTQEVERVHDGLLERGFAVGKVHIQGQDYDVHGVRMVLTPKVSPDLMYGTASQLTEEIARLVGK